MSITESVVLGAIQGLTEFIPISSSGHLVIAQYLMSGASEHLFLEWINLGTVLALVVYFRERLWAIVQSVIRQRDYRLLRAIVMAVLPAGLAGFVFASMIENSAFFSSPWVVAVMLAVVGVVLIIVERLPRLSPVKTIADLSPRRALMIGLVQVVALIPGTSRSGSTIIAGRLVGLKPAHAAEFSFLVSIPIMCGVITKLVLKSADRAYFMEHLTPLLIGNLIAFATGLVAVSFLMRYLRTRSLSIFGWYRIVLAVVLIGVLLLQ